VALTAIYLADKSALARFPAPQVGARLRLLLEEGLIATCATVDLEVLFSARTLADYEAVLAERRALDEAPITPAVMARAIDIQHHLARRGQHRIPIPDLIIAAAAESAGLIVLHYDADYQRIAAVTGRRHEWVVPRGTA
jgi:predicted nucleic acid-binding protein